MEQRELRILDERVFVYGSEYREARPSVLFATKDPGSAAAIAPVVLALHDCVNWRVYAENKSQGVMEQRGLSRIETHGSTIDALKQFMPDIVVTGLSVTPGVERAFTRLSKKEKRMLPVLWIVDSPGNSITQSHLKRLFDVEKKYGTRSSPDYFCVESETVKQFVLQAEIPGITHEKVFVTGQPAYDNLYDLSKEEKFEKIRKRTRDILNIPPDAKVLFFAGQMSGTAETLEHLVKALNDRADDLILAVRFHPRDPNKNIYPRLLNKLKKPLVDASLARVSDDAHVVVASDATISMYSSINQKAIYLRQPTACLLFEPKARKSFHKDLQTVLAEYPLVKTGAAVLITQANDINSFISDALYNEQFKARLRRIQKSQFSLDGKSTERVVAVIRNILKSQIDNK